MSKENKNVAKEKKKKETSKIGLQNVDLKKKIRHCFKFPPPNTQKCLIRTLNTPCLSNRMK